MAPAIKKDFSKRKAPLQLALYVFPLLSYIFDAKFGKNKANAPCGLFSAPTDNKVTETDCSAFPRNNTFFSKPRVYAETQRLRQKAHAEPWPENTPSWRPNLVSWNYWAKNAQKKSPAWSHGSAEDRVARNPQTMRTLQGLLSTTVWMILFPEKCPPHWGRPIFGGRRGKLLLSRKPNGGWKRGCAKWKWSGTRPMKRVSPRVLVGGDLWRMSIVKMYVSGNCYSYMSFRPSVCLIPILFAFF